MKKNFLILAVFTFLLCGCSFSLTKEKEQEKNLISEFKCPVLDDVKYKSEHYFITKDKDLYVYNVNQLYSNDLNCKKINVDTKVSRLVCGIECYVVDADDNYYVIDRESIDLVLKYKEGYFEHGIKEFLDNNEVIFKMKNIVLKTDGKLYKENGTTELELYKEIPGEMILEYGEHGDMQIMHDGDSKPVLGYYIRTDKAFYTTVVTNKEKCLKYADVECELEFAKNEVLTEKYNDISFYEIYYNYVDKDGNYYKLKHDEKMYE